MTSSDVTMERLPPSLCRRQRLRSLLRFAGSSTTTIKSKRDLVEFTRFAKEWQRRKRNHWSPKCAIFPNVKLAPHDEDPRVTKATLRALERAGYRMEEYG